MEFFLHIIIENTCLSVYIRKNGLKTFFYKIYKRFNVVLGWSHKSQATREISGNFFLVALWAVQITFKQNSRCYNFFPPEQPLVWTITYLRCAQSV